MNEKFEDKCDLNSYFITTDISKILKISNLIFDHIPNDKKIQKATNRMEMAKKGTFPKRKPIKVRKLNDGKYLIIDGNTTTTVLKSWGCTYVIAEESS